MALEVRLGDEARLTKDIDLGLRAEVESAAAVPETLVDALTMDRDGDRFEFAPATPQLLGADGSGHVTWRVSVAASLAGRTFGRIRLDVSPRIHELVATEHLTLPNSLDFASPLLSSRSWTWTATRPRSSTPCVATTETARTLGCATWSTW